MNNIPRFVWLNAFIFQALWWSAVLLGDQAVWLMLGLLILHGYVSPSRYADLAILPLALLGWLVEAEMVALGIIQFQSQLALPVYMLLLWIGLVWSFNHSLAWLQPLPWWGLSILGAVAGGLSYYAAHQLGVLQWGLEPWLSVIVIAIHWALLLPTQLLALPYLKRRLAHV
ncbi:MAG: DUF2878 domain-containing protein [Thiofilum sp.]|uniref:DUF2878 domain-containing protein n=1 Tax=Thiofilum sp. TaxID=2212733 RepID=UPI0025D280A0|nr:DUF2878 domain-containing protein [Thiofilum sp.]MBK8455376.1 DUF2878 domain-containing protein [Thiofilum sp.]